MLKVNLVRKDMETEINWLGVRREEPDMDVRHHDL